MWQFSHRFFPSPKVAGKDRRRARTATKRRPSLLRVEALEDRTVPATMLVTSAADDGSEGTLRFELFFAQDGDTVQFSDALAGQTISLQYGALWVPTSVNIEGLGADQLTIDGNFFDRDFVTAPGTDVTISGMTLTHGFRGLWRSHPELRHAHP